MEAAPVQKILRIITDLITSANEMKRNEDVPAMVAENAFLQARLSISKTVSSMPDGTTRKLFENIPVEEGNEMKALGEVIESIDAFSYNHLLAVASWIDTVEQKTVHLTSPDHSAPHTTASPADTEHMQRLLAKFYIENTGKDLANKVIGGVLTGAGAKFRSAVTTLMECMREFDVSNIEVPHSKSNNPNRGPPYHTPNFEGESSRDLGLSSITDDLLNPISPHRNLNSVASPFAALTPPDTSNFDSNPLPDDCTSLSKQAYGVMNNPTLSTNVTFNRGSQFRSKQSYEMSDGLFEHHQFYGGQNASTHHPSMVLKQPPMSTIAGTANKSPPPPHQHPRPRPRPRPRQQRHQHQRQHRPQQQQSMAKPAGYDGFRRDLSYSPHDVHTSSQEVQSVGDGGSSDGASFEPDGNGPPDGGNFYEVRISAPTLGITFFRPQELKNSLFLKTEHNVVDSLDERPVVAFVVKGSSARSAGVKLGDVLLKVDGVDVLNPEEASRFIERGSRALSLLFHVPATEIVVAEGTFMIKYDTQATTAPRRKKDWKSKYVVIGGILAQPKMVRMYRSKDEYHIAISDTLAARSVSVKVHEFPLDRAFIHDDDRAPQVIQYKGFLCPWSYIVIQRFNKNPIKIASHISSGLTPIHEHIRWVLRNHV